MFALHETTKIFLCRTAFVALGVLPLCAIAAAAAGIRLPAYRSAHEAALAERLGFDVRIGAVTLPRPGTTRYERVDLSDPQRNQLLARVPRVELSDDDGQLCIELSPGAIANGARLDAFWQVADDLLGRARTPLEVAVAAEQFTLHFDAGDLAFSVLDGRLEVGGEESRLALQFRPADQQPGVDPCEFTVVRRRDGSSSRRNISLATGVTPLPCTVASSFWPPINHLGSARFAGQLSIDEAGGHSKVEANGWLTGVELQGLMRHFPPHHLSGIANVNIEQATIIDGRLVGAAGKLTAGTGAISASLIHAADASLAMHPASDAVRRATGTIAYDRLGLAFALEGTTLALGGTAGRGGGAVLVQGGHVLVREPEDARQDVLNLVRLLAPPTERQMPSTRETEWLARVLPLPPAAKAAASPHRVER